jgi:hypothetical protein
LDDGNAVKVNVEANYKKNEESDDDYIDPAALARDPALREALEA